MKIYIFAALGLSALAAIARANDADNTGTGLVTNNHGGYNVVQPSVVAASAPLFGAKANNTGTALVTNNHGGYNVIEPAVKDASLPFFGSSGFASKVIAEAAHEKPKFVLVPVTEDVGHGGKIVVYKKVYFATAEDAEAAKASLLR